MAKEKRGRFKGAVSRNSYKQSQKSKFSYLNLPKGVGEFEEEPKTRVNLDFIPYEVTTEVHPDRDDEYKVAVPGSLWYKRPFWVHRNFGSENATKVCPSTIKKPCPICEYRAQLIKDGAAWDDDVVRGLRPSMRNLYVVIPKDHKKYEEKPHVWDISQFLFQNKLNEEIGENEEYEVFPDLEDGYTLQIRFSEESFGSNKFADTSRIDFKERKKPYKESILNEVPNLDEVLEIESYKSLSFQFYGNQDADEDGEYDNDSGRLAKDNDDDDEQEDTRSRGRSRGRGSEDDVPDDDGDDDDKNEEKDEEKEQEGGWQERRRQRNKPEPEKDKGKCPHGHKFGKDNDEHDDCETCDDWDDCFDAKG